MEELFGWLLLLLFNALKESPISELAGDFRHEVHLASCGSTIKDFCKGRGKNVNVKVLMSHWVLSMGFVRHSIPEIGTRFELIDNEIEGFPRRRGRVCIDESTLVFQIWEAPESLHVTEME